MATSTKSTLQQLGVKRIAAAAGIVEYRLDNGLKVLLKENHSAPVVSFMVVYRVGSRNEANGFTGSTHFLEHMMFKGTKRFSPEKGNGVMETFGRIGALLNATTWLDRTNYFECVSSEYLELCVEVEADRMRNLRLRQEDRDSEMTVVRNEFERGENDPASALDKELNAIAFREHPYHWPTIGWRDDVEGVPMERMKDFYDTYYWPDNATVIIVGDFTEDQALKMIVKHFGKIPSSPNPIPEVYTQEPPQEGERRFILKRSGDLPQLVIGYHTPESTHPDTYALSALRAILGDAGKRSSRLYKALMDTGLCTSCYSQNGEFRDPALFEIGATITADTSRAQQIEAVVGEMERSLTVAFPADKVEQVSRSLKKLVGATVSNFDKAEQLVTGELEKIFGRGFLDRFSDKAKQVVSDLQKKIGATMTPASNFDKVEQVIYDELRKLAEEPVTEDELRRAKSANRKGTVLANADPMAFINLLCQAEASADWKWAIDYDDKFDEVTPEDIMRVARIYFSEDNRTVGRFIPTEKDPDSAPVAMLTTAASGNGKENGKGKGSAAKTAAAKKTAPVKVERMELARPQVTKATFASQVVRKVLPNGLTLLIMPNPGTGSIAIQGAIFGGDFFAPLQQYSLPGVTANMMTKGSKSWSKGDLAELLEEMGTRLGFGTDRFKVNFGTLIVKEDFGRMVPVLADILRNPLFVEEELTQTRREFTAALTKAQKNTSQRARQALMQNIYDASHPFHERSYESRITELTDLKNRDLSKFHQQVFAPKNTIITIVGDIDADTVEKAFEESLGDWKGGERLSVILPAASLPTQSKRVDIPLADKANVDIFMGHPTALSRGHEDFFAAYIANSALGGDTIADRLGKELRVKHGLTYGIYSGFEDLSFGCAAWTVHLSVNPSNIDFSLELVEKVLADYHKKGITKAELEDKVGDAVGSFNVQLRSSSGIAQALVRFEFMGLGIEALDRLADDFYAVTKPQVDAAIRNYMHPDKLVTTIAGTFAKEPVGVS